MLNKNTKKKKIQKEERHLQIATLWLKNCDQFTDLIKMISFFFVLILVKRSSFDIENSLTIE